MLRDNLVGLIEPMLSSAGANPLALCTARKKPSDDRPPCLENPRPEGAESTLTENAASPFHAEPKQIRDQLFNSSEKRLARILLLLAHFGKEGKPETVIPQLSQETLAEMIGTTRSRVSFFMNRFRKLGFIDYHAGDELQVHSSLLNIVLHD